MGCWGLAELPVLSGPYEILELGDRESREFRVLKYELGRMTIVRKDGVKKEIKALRVFVPREDKPLGPNYCDITSQTLIAQLLPILDEVVRQGRRVRVTAFGVAPSKRFTVEVV